MVGTEAIAISARLYQDVSTVRVEIDPILVNVKIHGKEFCATSQFAGNYQFLTSIVLDVNQEKLRLDFEFWIFKIFSSPCVHGTCTSIDGFGHKCVCDNGWKGDDCSQCIPYLDCPNQKDDACMMPNECHCPKDTIDIKGLCKKLRKWTKYTLTLNCLLCLVSLVAI